MIAFAKPDDVGSGNPDPTMRHPRGSPKGENMPPVGGESMEPADSKRSPTSAPAATEDETLERGAQ